MLSLRSGGQSSSELTGKYLGNGIKNLTRGIYMILVVLVGAAFVNGPAGLLTTITEGYINFETWALIIFAYYVLATLLPIDKVIGRIYPFFGAALLFMALSIAGYLIFGDVHLQELSFANLKNYHIAPKENILFPMIFIVVSCGAISGFHATQSPMMARCLKKESHGRLAFYGAMITEGIIAIIWATAAINYFGGPEKLNEILSQPNHNPAWLVNTICNTWLGKTGAILAIIGVVACPITTGDTAYRSARLLIADVFKIDQKPIFKRVLVALPVFAIGFYLSKTDFGLLWKYVGILNQTLASIFLWTIAIYLAQKNKIHWYISIPATFLTAIVVMYFLVAPYSQGGLFLNVNTGYIVGCVLGLFAFGAFLYYAKKCKNQKFD